MSRSSCARCLLTCLVLCAALSSPAAQTPPDAASADARLRALYTEEWKWRQKEMARRSDSPARRRERPLPEGRRRVAAGAARVLDARRWRRSTASRSTSSRPRRR